MLLSLLARFLRNRLVNAYPLFDGCGNCKDVFRPVRLLGNLAPSFPIDVVYTWVDGSDPALAKKRAAWRAGKSPRLFSGAALYHDNGELRYSLRSVETYAPWVRRIFIATDGQAPGWLNRAHKKICLVDHKDFIPAEHLPTFNSHVIEAFLHRIPGLAEHYIYFNDDFFLSAPCEPGDFFTAGGLPFLFVDWRMSRRQSYVRRDTPHAASYGNARAWLESSGMSPVPDVLTAHGPYPQTRSNVLEALEHYAGFISGFTQNRFRAMNELATHCHAVPLWAYARKRTVPRDLPSYYINTKRFDRRNFYKVLLRDRNSGTLPLFFCLNETGHVLEPLGWRSDLAAFLKRFFPRPSAFELTAGSFLPQALRYPQTRFARSAPAGVSPLRRLLRRLLDFVLKYHPVAGGCGACALLIPSSSSRLNHAGQPRFPVDVVYTWVDGSDYAHAAKRAGYLGVQADAHVTGLVPARFRDNDELRYSLRSLEDCAPWVDSVILVTDSQVPSWIAKDHPKLRLVDHREFIPEKYLPTFNSHVIEAFLHRIPGLSEHYIYMNDDVFLARPARKSDFFTPGGLPLAFTDWRWRRIRGYHYTKTPHARSYFNTLRLLKERGAPTDPGFITAHGPYAQTGKNAEEAFAFYRDVIEGFAGNRFRGTGEIAMYSHALPLLLYRRKRLLPCDERYYYVQAQRPDRAAYYRAILQARADRVPPLFFCLNDVGGKPGATPWRKDLRRLLAAYYPVPSSFEVGLKTVFSVNF